MGKLLQKYGLCLLCTILLVAMFFYGNSQTAQMPFYFQTEGPWGTERIDAFETADGVRYVFLPSYAGMEDLRASVSFSSSVMLEGIEVTDGMNCAQWKTDRVYSLTVDGRDTPGLQFVCSGNVATLHIDTGSGTTHWLHEDKANEESASLRLITAEGEKQYHNDSCTIQGRGNATWTKEKKPYNLTLPREANLLGMGADTDWVLLSNSTDESNLHNRLAFDLAEAVGLSWTPESRFVDVYMNGTYQGLYLLTEKVEIGPERLDLDADRGDFLCKVDLPDRWDTLRSPFRTAAGRTVEITGPKILSETEQLRIQKQVQEMENELLSGKNLKEWEGLDGDSWVRRYLLDEVLGNIDSDVASSYFYSKNGVFYAGPAWDYDMTLGNRHRNEFPNSFIAKNYRKSPLLASPWYSAMYENADFYGHMTELYERVFLPELEALLDGGIAELAESIAPATRANSLRWQEMFRSQYVFLELIPSTADTVESWLRQRVDFLSSAWLENTAYCTVQYELEPGGSYGVVSVKPGERMQISYFETLGYQWYDAETGAAFDPQLPIEKDTILTLDPPRTGSKKPAAAEKPAQEPVAAERPATQDLLVLVSLGVMLILLIGMASMSILHNRPKHRNKSETPV